MGYVVSIWNRIGDVASTAAKNAFKFGGEVLGAGAGAARLGWDIGTAPWNDAEEYNGFIQPFKTAVAKEGGDIIKPLASAGGAIMKVPGVAPALERINKINQEYIREPLTTFELVQGDVLKGQASFFDPNEWKKAYQGAQDISFGQAFVNKFRSIYDPKFNIYDPREREAAFKKSAWGKSISGGLDVIAQLTGDVSLAAGKAVKVAKASELGVGKLSNADIVAKAAEDITKAQYGVNNRFSKVLDDFTKNDSVYALNHPMVKSSNQPGLLAHLLGDSVDRDETALILRSALGDPAAMDELRLQRAYITDALETARGDLSAVDEYKLFAAPDEMGMIPFLNDNKAVIDAAEENYKSLVASDQYFSKLMQLGEAGGSLTRTTGKALQGAEDFIAQSRALKFYDKTVGNPKVEVFQPTPFHRLYQKISWLAGERPAGLVDFNDPDSYKEVLANVSQLEKLVGLTPEQSKKMLDSYIAAATPEARFTAAMNLESSAVRALTKKYNIDEDVATKIYNNYNGARTSALKSINDKGFMVDTDGSILKVPQLESQTANYLPLMDFELMDSLLKRNSSLLNSFKGRAVDTTVNLVDVLQDAFKAGALLRLGYTQRNAIDSQLRIAASVGAMASLRHLGPGLKNIINNSIAVPARLIDRYRPVDSNMTYAQIEQASRRVIGQLDELKKKIATAEAKVSLRKNDADALGELNTLKELQKEKLDIYNHYSGVLNKASGTKSKPLFPNVKDYKDGGRGGLPNTRSVVGFVDTKYLSKMPGNAVDEKGINFYREKLRSGQGFDEPIMVVYDNETGLAYVGEGNHRLQAALLENTPYVPVRVVRGNKSEMVPNKQGRSPQQVKNNKTLPFTTGSAKGEVEYMPTDVHPSFIFDKQYVVDQDLFAQGGKEIKSKQRIGTGSFEVVTSDGEKYILNDAFGGPLGEMFRKIASSGNSFERMVDSNTDMYMRQLASKGIAQVKPTDPAYFDQWAQTLRTQFGNSAVVNKIIAGESPKEIARWLRNSPEGRDLRQRLSITSSEASEYVTKVNGFLDQYLPASTGLRSKLKDITANDLRAAFKDPTELPVIHGHILEENMFNLSRFKGKEIINTLFKFLGSLPEDTLARNPLYVHFYRQEAKRRVEIMASQLGDKFTKADQEKIMAVAHKQALREMKSVLFNIERKTNFAMAMKYISPFFSAQENAYKTWSKMAVANPQIVNRGYLVWNSPNRAGLVTDQDGNEVPAGKTTGNDVIWIGLPKGITKIPGLQSLDQLGIPKGSLDILFQGGLDALYMKGNPNIFSDIFPVGPYVAIPVSEVVKRQPSLEDAFKWALPFGPSKNAVSGLLPSWFQKLQTRFAGQDDPAFARSYQLIWNTEQQKAKRNGLPPVSADKVLKMTQDYWNMRTAANLILPFAPRFDSPYRFYLEKSREYKRTYGLDADAKFLEDYPEFFAFSASLSSNPTGIQSSVQAVNNIKKYSGLVGELSNIEPKLIGLIANDPSGYDFSQAAYDYLYGKKISAGSPEKFLSSKSPVDAQKKNEAEKGWIIYNKFADAIDEELARRNLSSIQQTGAEDLRYLKEQVKQKLSVQTDANGKPIVDPKTGQFLQTAWKDDYDDSDGSKTNRVIVGLSKILSNDKFMEANKNNTTWKSVSAYLDIRKAIASELAKRETKTIDAKANIDLKFVYDGMVNKLKKDDKLGFAYLYDRFLSQDLVYDKYLTPKETK